ncbi:MAG: hypothetical protein WBL35_15085 [Ornithinibacter sp.]
MCSYCGCENIEVVGRFMAEHVEIINASGVLRRACEIGEASQVASGAAHLAGLLHPHTAAEEVGVFAAAEVADRSNHHR